MKKVKGFLFLFYHNLFQWWLVIFTRFSRTKRPGRWTNGLNKRVYWYSTRWNKMRKINSQLETRNWEARHDTILSQRIYKLSHLSNKVAVSICWTVLKCYYRLNYLQLDPTAAFRAFQRKDAAREYFISDRCKPLSQVPKVLWAGHQLSSYMMIRITDIRYDKIRFVPQTFWGSWKSCSHWS